MLKPLSRILALILMVFSITEIGLSQTMPCADDISVSVTCRNNKTACDPSDDFYELWITYFYGRGGAFYAEFGGNKYGPYMTNQPIYVTTVPADGRPLCIDLTHEDRPVCLDMICTDTLKPCSDGAISIDKWSVKCNDNRTANDVSDDFYECEIVVEGPDRFQVEYELRANGNLIGVFPYWLIIKFNLPADGNPVTLSVVDVDDQGCADQRITPPLRPCSEPCTMEPQVLDWYCNDNGTPDPTDDLIIVNVIANAFTPSSFNKYKIETQFFPPVQLDFGVVQQIILPARGQYANLRFSDVWYVDCFEDIEIGPLDHCSEVCVLEVTDVELKCDDNDSPDPGDDFYTVCLTVVDSSAGSGYNVTAGAGKTFGPFLYDSVQSFTLAADGSTPRLNIIDVDNPKFCKTFTILDSLNPCSFPCDMSLDSLILDCDDNGSSQLTDDFYNVRFLVSSPLVTAMDSFVVIIDGNSFGPYSYSQLHALTWPADGGTYEFLIQDWKLGASCELRDTIGPLEPCSSPCDLDINVSNVLCNDNRTGLDPSDDTFTFDLTVNGSNVGPSWRADDPAMTTANYGATRSFGPYPISGGNVNLVIQDVADRFCRENVSISPPPACSDSCFIEIIDYTEGPCDDNNTGPDKTDDFFFVDLLVNGQNTGAAQMYTVTVGFNVLGPYTYGVLESVGPIPANGNWQILVIEDQNFGYCQAELRLRKDPCSECDGNTADAGSDKVITCSQNAVRLSGSASAQGTYNWVGPSNQQYSGPNPNVGDPGMYILTVTFAKGCTDSDTVIVTRDTNLPIADPGSDQFLTCIVDTVIIGGPRTSSGPNLIYIWTDINGNVIADQPTTEIILPGTYCLEVIDTVLDCASAVNCVVVGEMRDEPSGEILVNPEDAFDCRIDSIQLTAGNTDGSSHHWEKRTISYYTDTLWVTDTGMVQLVITDTLTGCTKILDIEINSLVDYPFINIQRPDTITCRREQVTINGQASQGGPTIVYQWYDSNGNLIPGASQRTLVVTEPGTYYFHVLDNFNGCENYDTIVVPERRVYPTADAGGDKIIKCDSTTTVLTASGSTVGNSIVYEWAGLGSGSVIAGGDTRFPQVNGEGNFVLTVRNNATGCASKDTVYVNKVYAPSIDHLVVKGERCGGDELGSIDVLGISGIRPFTYQMNGRPVTTTSFDSLRPGLFFFRVTDSLGCRTDTLLEVWEGNYLNFKITGDTFITKGDSTILRVEVDLPPQEIDQMYWSEDGSVFCFRCYEIVVKPDTTTIFNFRLIDINGCEIELDFEVRVQQRNDIFVPNIFTPNEDTENEILHVFGKHLVNIERIMIFNRWGELVFRGYNLPPGPIWDGKWNGNYHVPAVLTYVIDAVFDDGERKQFTGDITLLR